MFGERFVPGFLEEGGKRWVDRGEVLELIDDENFFLSRTVFSKEGDECYPVVDFGALQALFAGECGKLLPEALHAYHFPFFGCEEIESRFVFDEFGDQCGFSNTPSTVYDNKP